MASYTRGPNGSTGETITAPNGEQFYIYGKKIDELLTRLVQTKIKEKVSEIA